LDWAGWGRILVDLARTSPKLRVVRVADVIAQAEDFARERGLPFSSTFDDVLADPRVQAVVLATPHSQHTAQIIAAARSTRDKPACGSNHSRRCAVCQSISRTTSAVACRPPH
jgi:Oxidoreductase family, NAD-binding Rossmann fold